MNYKEEVEVNCPQQTDDRDDLCPGSLLLKSELRTVVTATMPCCQTYD